MKDTTIQFTISDKDKKRLEAHPDFPSKRKGQARIPAFYRKVFLAYMESSEFKLTEVIGRVERAEREIHRLKQQLAKLEGRDLNR